MAAQMVSLIKTTTVKIFTRILANQWCCVMHLTGNRQVKQPQHIITCLYIYTWSLVSNIKIVDTVGPSNARVMIKWAIAMKRNSCAIEWLEIRSAKLGLN